ncbi:DNA primase [Polymorphobacter multimanifer]|uniref:DNA primase n=1 Tax=Polymorphobacter multimanifer TaxID=1070431 RepID=A0A841LGQ8_9SPHN|nr:DNA primase [Polymorphobacter multimanifer]MBB6228382.1 DNA primase [Polymorphobacter multimanifer]
MSLSPAFLDELRARVPLSPVVGRRVKLVRAGREWKGCCPFHNEKTPSFYVNDDKGFYHCFGCGAHGDVFRFLTEQEGLPFMDAVTALAAQAGMEVPAASPQAQARADENEELQTLAGRAADWFRSQLAAPAGSEARAYLARRGVSEAIVAAFGLGFAPGTGLKAALGNPQEAAMLAAGLLGQGDDGRIFERFRGRLIFPIRDRRGRVVGFGGRAIESGSPRTGARGGGDVQPKYLNSADGPLFDKGRLLYNLDRAGPAARKADRLVVVEGYMDVIGVAGAGIAELVAPLGTAMTEAQLELAWRLVDVPILCFDGDGAGQRAAVRAALRALPLLKPGKSLAIATLPPGEDPDDLVKRGGPAAFEAVLAAARPLAEALWLAETAGAETATPETRAAVRSRLKAHAETILDPDVRALYRADFDARFDAAYLARRRSAPAPQRGAFKGRGAWAPQPQPVSSALKAQAAGGGDSAESIAVVAGLLRNPWLADSHGEAISALPLGAGRAARLRDAVLAAATHTTGLDARRLDAHLHSAGLAEAADALCRANRLRFSFCIPDSAKAPERSVQARDFALVVGRLSARSGLEAELAMATAALAQAPSEDGFRRQQALVAERQELDAAMMRLAESMRED